MPHAFSSFLRTDDHPEGRPIRGERPVVFHHIPKTAGSTFRRILESYFEPGQICPGELDDELPEAAGGPGTPALYAGHFSWAGAPKTGDPVRLLFLRDPVERAVSEYHNLHDWARYPEPWKRRVESRPALRRVIETIRSISLEEYATSDDPGIVDRLTNRQARSLVGPPAGLDLWNAAEHLADADPADESLFPVQNDALLAEASGRLSSFAFVGLQHRFDDSLRLLAMTLGLRPIGSTDAYSINRNPKKTGEPVPPAVREAIEARNPVDRALLDAAERLFDRRTAAFRAALLREGADLVTLPHRLPAHAGSPEPRRWPIESLPVRRGCHRLENDGLGRPFCWTGYEDPAVLELEHPVANGAELGLRVECLANASGEPGLPLEAALDGVRAEPTGTEDRDGMLVWTGTVRLPAPAWPRRVHTLELRVPAALEPETCEHRRRIGIALHAVEMHPTGA